MVGGKIEGSNDGTTWSNIYTISEKGTGPWQEFSFSNTTLYSRIRFVAGPLSFGELVEIECYNNTNKLKGTAFGSKDHADKDADGGLKALDGRDDNGIWHGKEAGAANYAGFVLNSCQFGSREGILESKINGEELNQTANASPNPMCHELRIELNNMKDESVSLDLTDLMGRPLIQKVVRPASSHHSEVFDVSREVIGMYLLQIKTSSKRQTIKVLKVD